MLCYYFVVLCAIMAAAAIVLPICIIQVAEQKNSNLHHHRQLPGGISATMLRRMKMSYTSAAVDFAMDYASSTYYLIDAKNTAAPKNKFHVKDVMYDTTTTTMGVDNFYNGEDIVAVHVRLERYYNGLRVIGGDCIVHLNATNQSLLGISQTIQASLQHITTDSITLAQLQMNTTTNNSTTSELVIYGRRSMMLFTSKPILAWDMPKNIIAKDGTPMVVHYIIDAINGVQVDQFSDTKTLLSTGWPSTVDENVQLHDDNNNNDAALEEVVHLHITANKEPVICFMREAAVGIGNTMYHGKVKLSTSFVDGLYYQLKDPLRDCHYTVNDYLVTNSIAFFDEDNNETFFDYTLYNIWGSDHKSSPSSDTMNNNTTAAADVHFGYAASFDFFMDMFGRQGIYNNDNYNIAVVSSKVHFGYELNNAYWYNGKMSYGIGDSTSTNPFTALEIVVHEMTHGVTEATANFIYSGESGGLDEATSDIFAVLADFHTSDRPFYSPNYLIGENVFINRPGSFYRSMIQPSDDAFLYNGLKSSYDCYCKKIGLVDVHFSSGVANHFFYLLAEGTVNGIPSMTCNIWDCQVATGMNKTLLGIGKEKAGHVWYRALTRYFISDTNYAGARDATIQAAKDLYTHVEVAAVEEAWAAVNVVSSSHITSNTSSTAASMMNQQASSPLLLKSAIKQRWRRPVFHN